MSELYIQLCSSTAKSPEKKSELAAGYDIYSDTNGIIPPRESRLISTGIKIRMPEGVYGRIASRSGLSVRCGIDVGAGVIDRDYQGEIKILLRNHSDQPFEYNTNNPIAQLILEKYLSVNISITNDIESFGKTARGTSGFGSTDG